MYTCINFAGTWDISEVYKLLLPAKAKWDAIGISLGLDFDTLMAINQRCKTVDQCLYSMIMTWIQGNKANVTYNHLVKVLKSRDIREKKVAQAIMSEKGTYHKSCRLIKGLWL